MRLLWITNGPIGAMRPYPRKGGGGWMDAMLADVAEIADIELTVATIAPGKKIKFFEESGVRYYILPAKRPLNYNYKSTTHLQQWRELIDREKPDIIQLWGTEYAHGLVTLNAAEGIPSVIYMQGIVAAVARYYEAGISLQEIFANMTLRDISRFSGILGEKRKYYKRSLAESEIIRKSGNIICENEWCRAHCRAIFADCNFFTLPLNINKVFYNFRWSIERVEKHTIMTNASGYPLKGLHILLKALSLVKRTFPDVLLYVPGAAIPKPQNIWQSIYQQGYHKYINRLIKDHELDENIIFLGDLTAEQMAARMETVSTFVVPSALENHSSTLKEAMIVGTPSIAAYVGGIPEYVTHGENGFLYRFEEYEMLAGYIEQIFASTELATKLSRNGSTAMRQMHDSKVITQNMINIYKDILSKHM